MTKIKMYKPGQLLTIRGRVYRVKRAKHYSEVCGLCDARYICFKLYKALCIHTPPICYLQLVVPKSPMG